MKKVIVAQINIKESSIAEFLNLAEDMVANTNTEPGCICYKLLDAVAEKGEFFFYEEYTDAAAIDAHNASDHFKAFGKAIAPLISQAPIVDVF